MISASHTVTEISLLALMLSDLMPVRGTGREFQLQTSSCLFFSGIVRDPYYDLQTHFNILKHYLLVLNFLDLLLDPRGTKLCILKDH